MIVKYKINWDSVSTKRHPSDDGFVGLLDVFGLLLIDMDSKVLNVDSENILMDLVQVINAFSFYITENYRNRVLTLSFDDRPALFVSYDSKISIYEYNPEKYDINSNPVLDTMSYEAAIKLSADIKSQIVAEIDENFPNFSQIYQSLLR